MINFMIDILNEKFSDRRTGPMFKVSDLNATTKLNPSWVQAINKEIKSMHKFFIFIDFNFFFFQIWKYWWMFENSTAKSTSKNIASAEWFWKRRLRKRSNKKPTVKCNKYRSANISSIGTANWNFRIWICCKWQEKRLFTFRWRWEFFFCSFFMQTYLQFFLAFANSSKSTHG